MAVGRGSRGQVLGRGAETTRLLDLAEATLGRELTPQTLPRHALELTAYDGAPVHLTWYQWGRHIAAGHIGRELWEHGGVHVADVFCPRLPRRTALRLAHAMIVRTLREPQMTDGPRRVQGDDGVWHVRRYYYRRFGGPGEGADLVADPRGQVVVVSVDDATGYVVTAYPSCGEERARQIDALWGRAGVSLV